MIPRPTGTRRTGLRPGLALEYARRRMKLKIFLQGFLVLVAISFAHVSMNVAGGWRAVWEDLFGAGERGELQIGFLPVT